MKRPRGRPPKPKPEVEQPKRPRGRPKKEPPVEVQPKRPRGRPPKPKPEPQELKHDSLGRFMPSGVIKSDEEMDAHNLVVAESALYSKTIDSGAKVGMLIKNLSDEMSKIGTPINFRDTETVRDTCMRYLRSCERTGVIPSKTGLARACGVSSKGIDAFVKKNPGHPSAELFQILIEAFAEALSQASLNGSVHPIVGIFLQKALYGVRENSPVIEPADTPLSAAKETTDLFKKYLPSYDE